MKSDRAGGVRGRLVQCLEPAGVTMVERGMQVVRFSEAIKAAGIPAVHLAWTAPAHDPVLRRALQQKRLMTLHPQLRGGKKDFGVVGFEPGKGAQFLIFPRSLRRFSGKRVIAVNYDLLERALSSGPGPRRDSKRRRQPTKVKTGDAEVVKFVPPVLAEKVPEPDPPPTALDDDPVMSEVRRALVDLREAHPILARRRLQKLVQRADRGKSDRR